MNWWNKNNMRLIQTNLRETDMNLDVDSLFKTLDKYAANTLLINAGGIVSFYPTKLQYQYRASGQSQDLLEKVINKAKRDNMKVIVRFDFSKAQEQLFVERPEWFYRTYEGKEVNYHGIVHTCVNGEYQREYSLKIIDEVISNYDVDGIFFNMFGYQTHDYSGNHYGRCYCENCQNRFQEKYQLNIPEPGEKSFEILAAYKAFQEETTKEMLDNIHDLVKEKRPDVAIATYHDHKIDIVMNESNTALFRPLPKWIYSASENVKSVQDSWDDKFSSNICINAVDLSHRFVGVSKHEVAIRLYQNIANGSGLSFCIIGVFEDYPDMEFEEVVKEVYHFHKENEKYYGSFKSLANIALVKPSYGTREQREEYLGIFKMLKERHQQFDVIQQHQLLNKNEEMKKYKGVILPHIDNIDDQSLKALQQLQESGVSIIVTSKSNANLTQSLLSANILSENMNIHSAYLNTSNSSIFQSFPLRKRIVLEGYFAEVNFSGAKKSLNLISSAVYGPPERSGGNKETNIAGLGIISKKGISHVYLPWEVGRMYYNFGFEDYKNVFFDVLNEISVQDQTLTTDAHQSVEVFFNKVGENKYLLQALNLSGFDGMTYASPIKMPRFSVNLKGIGKVLNIKSLANEEGAHILNKHDEVSIEFENLRLFQSVIIHTDKKREGKFI